MLDESYYRKTGEIIARYGKEPKALIPVMQDVQAEYRYLPGELLSYIAGTNRHYRNKSLQRGHLL